jgi:hypothetical protein
MSIAPAERVETSLEELAGLDFEPEMKVRVGAWRVPQSSQMVVYPDMLQGSLHGL